MASMERISSRQNPIVRRFRDAAAGRGETAGLLLLDGAHLVEDAIAAGIPLEIAAFAERHLPGRFDTLAARAAAAGAPIVIVTDAVMAAMSPVQQSSGVVALARQTPLPLASAFAGDAPLVLLLDAVQDPGNVGAIIRTADACGATGVVADPAGADPFGWKALRGAMGSTFRLPVARHALGDAVAGARARGLRIVATVPRGGTPLPSCDLRGPSAILLGGEGPGLDGAILQAADERITIPMRPPVESLNVAVAAALVLYEAARQRAAAR
jgi:TrmH family RNA methyltransferase